MVAAFKPFQSGFRLLDGTDINNAFINSGASAPANFTPTGDPGVSADSTQGYQVGSLIINPTTNRAWRALSVAPGAAVWILEGVVPGVGIEPSNMITQFGAGTGSFFEEGNLLRQVSAAGITPAGTGADFVLAVYTLPASSFDIAGRGINVMACGSTASNTNSKTMKLIYNATTAVVGTTVTGGTTIASLGLNTTAGSGGWNLNANVFKAGAAGSNTQVALHEASQGGSVVGALQSPTTNLTATESGAIIIAVTGNAAVATADIALNFVEVNAMN
jgi:hypothetical protein